MEVLVQSVEMVKPSWHPSRQLPPPFKLCLLDQLTPPYYTPLILFYPTTGDHSTPEMASIKLKQSLSHTLASFYPLSGRVKDDNLVVDDFDEGVPFVESRVRGYHLAEFLRPPKLEFLNQLLPVEPCCRHPVKKLLPPPPQVTVQVNAFDCGGIAIGMCFYHRTVDGATVSAFLEAWSARCRRRRPVDDNMNEEEVVPAPDDLSGGCTTFPPRESGVSTDFLSRRDKLWFPLNSLTTTTTTRRFVFHNDAIAALKSRARDASIIDNPSRMEAILAFIWKATLSASAASGSPKLLSLSQPVNLRPRLKKKKKSTTTTHRDDDGNVGLELSFTKYSIGNLYSTAMSFCDDDNVDSSSIPSLARLVREGIASSLDEEHLDILSSHRGLEAIAEGIEKFKSMGVPSLKCSSWVGLGFCDVDFGWGKPVWSGVVGETNGSSSDTDEDRNVPMGDMLVLKELAAEEEKDNNGFEAWLRLDRVHMASLDKDPEFLEFASSNPPIIF